jgi:hypothetical protein
MIFGLLRDVAVAAGMMGGAVCLLLLVRVLTQTREDRVESLKAKLRALGEDVD